jgi:hypothetical protein
LDHRRQPAVLPAELRELFRVTKPGRIGERPLDLVGAGEGGR